MANARLAQELRQQLSNLPTSLSSSDFKTKFTEIRTALRQAPGGVIADPAGCEAAQAEAASTNDRFDDLEKATAEPEKPDKPRLADFLEVRRLCGTFTANYAPDPGGIVVISSNEYYVIKRANAPLFSRVCGYVRKDGPDIFLGNGHFATSMVVADSIQYREALPEAKASYAEAVQEYQQEFKAWQRTQTPTGRAALVDAKAQLDAARMERQRRVARVAAVCFGG